MDELHELDAFCNAVAKTIAQYWGINFEDEEGEKDMSLTFTSGTLKKKYEERVNTRNDDGLLDDAAVKILGYKSKLENGTLADGDRNAIAIEVAVELYKQHKEKVKASK